MVKFFPSRRLFTLSLPHLLTLSPLHLFLTFTLWAFILTYPLILHFFNYIPLGSEAVGTVPFFNLWTLQWNIDQLMQGYLHYWDAPIFAPTKGTFAFSEPQPLTALLAAPLWLAWQSPALAYNTVVILFLTLNGWFTYWLLKSWGLPSLPALLAGLLAQSMPFIAQEMGVLQLIAVFGFLWSLLYLSRFLTSQPVISSPRHLWWNGLCLALGTPATFFTCGYYGLFSLCFLPLAFLFQLQRRHLNLKTVSQLLAIGLLALLLIGPLMWAQQQRLASNGLTRSAQTIENNSAKLGYYRNFLDYNVWYGQLLGKKSESGQRLFPGFGLIFLAGLGLFGRSRRGLKIYLIVATALALSLSLGLRLNLGGFLPYQWVRENIPGFGQLRSPFRFAVLVQLHLVLLAGFGLDNLSRWFYHGKIPILSLAMALTLFEALALPLPLQALPAWPAALSWQLWLNEQNQSPTIVLLPFAQSSQVADFEQTTRWMLISRSFKGNILNGYSGFFPTDHGRLREEMLKFPTPESLDLLLQKEADYVVVYYALANAPQRQTIEPYLPLVYHDELNKVAIYTLAGQD